MKLVESSASSSEAQVRENCGSGDWKARAEDGRGKGSAWSFIGWAVRRKRKGSEEIGWDWPLALHAGRRWLSMPGSAIGGGGERKAPGKKK